MRALRVSIRVLLALAGLAAAALAAAAGGAAGWAETPAHASRPASASSTRREARNSAI